MDRLEAVPAFDPPINASFGGRSFHERSHGETFLSLQEPRFGRNGLFLLDEPEAALSPQPQLALLVLVEPFAGVARVSGGADFFVRWRADS